MIKKAKRNKIVTLRPFLYLSAHNTAGDGKTGFIFEKRIGILSMEKYIKNPLFLHKIYTTI